MSDNLESVAKRIAKLAVRDLPGFGKVGPGPVLSVVRDTLTGKIYVGLNTGAPAEVADVLQKSIQAQKIRISNGHVTVVRTEPMAADGGHSEAVALNAAIRAREKLTNRKMSETELGVFELHNVWLKGERAHSAAARCEHCARITRGVALTQSMFVAEGGRMGVFTVPQRGMVKRSGAAKFDPVTTVSGEIKPVRTGTAPPTGNGGGAASGVGLGVMALAKVIAEPMVKAWFAKHYLQSKWDEESKAMVMKAINEKLWLFNLLIMSRLAEILEARTAGKRVAFHVYVDTEWVDTDFGPAQTSAAVSYYGVVIGDQQPVAWPVIQPNHLFGPRITIRREGFGFIL